MPIICLSKQQLKISINIKRIFLLIIIFLMVLYLIYKGFVYWDYNLFKGQKQVETWNSRVKKQWKMKQENKEKWR